MTDTQRNKRPARRPDCVTETRIGICRYTDSRPMWYNQGTE